MNSEKITLRALQMISKSSLVDFKNALTWAQWCRDVACAARDGDEELLSLLEYPIAESIYERSHK